MRACILAGVVAQRLFAASALRGSVPEHAAPTYITYVSECRASPHPFAPQQSSWSGNFAFLIGGLVAGYVASNRKTLQLNLATLAVEGHQPCGARYRGAPCATCTCGRSFEHQPPPVQDVIRDPAPTSLPQYASLKKLHLATLALRGEPAELKDSVALLEKENALSDTTWRQTHNGKPQGWLGPREVQVWKYGKSVVHLHDPGLS